MTAVYELTTSQEELKLINDNPSVIIFFGSQRCPACVMFKPIYEELPNKYPDAVFAHVEVSTTRVVNIKEYPIIAGYKNGEYIGQVIGADKEGVEMLIQETLES